MSERGDLQRVALDSLSRAFGVPLSAGTKLHGMLSGDVSLALANFAIDYAREQVILEREACAKVADEHRENAKRMQRQAIATTVVSGHRMLKEFDEVDCHRAAAANAANIAAAIRARGDVNDDASDETRREIAEGREDR